MKLSDVLIIGGGPAGLYASFYSGLRGLKVQIIEHHSELGGKLNLYPEKIVWDIGAVPPAPANSIKMQMIEQAKVFQPDISVSTTCEDIKKHENYFETITNNGSFYSKSIIIATGRGIWEPVKLDVQGSEKFELTNLHYTIKQMKRFKNKKVIISGSGNSAIDWADALSDIAAEVTLIHRSGELKAHEGSIEKLKTKAVTIKESTTIEALHAEKDPAHVDHVSLSDGSIIEIDEVLINHGYDSNIHFLETIENDLDFGEYQVIRTKNFVDTNIPGIFACGDQVDYNHRIHLIAGCFTEAGIAANHVKVFLDEEASIEGMVSSHNKVFEQKNKSVTKRYS
ncbi:NAD(P)/FAD-dependent oxidoreductase [Corticicoccus populi]|uniref:Ferredoxin--NADP reductase n=1 Tax=Corticicoccus populi TaxID=1812821 RepID=A0ABW5WYQ6_9STAP